MMTVSLNGQETTVSPSSTLHTLLEAQQLAEKKGIAVAVNQTVVPRKHWHTHVLQANDHILVIKATQGG